MERLGEAGGSKRENGLRSAGYAELTTGTGGTLVDPVLKAFLNDAKDPLRLGMIACAELIDVPAVTMDEVEPLENFPSFRSSEGG